MLHKFALPGIGIGKADELSARCLGAGHLAAGRIGNAARSLHSMSLEECLYGVEEGAIGYSVSAEALDVDLVDVDLAVDRVPRFFKVSGILHPLYIGNRNVDRNLEGGVRGSRV